MVEKRKNIDNLFKDYLVGHQAKAPVNAWSRLQSELHPAQNRRFIYYTRLAAAAILLLIAFGAGYFYSEFNKPVKEQVAITNPEPLQEETITNLNPPIKNVADVAKDQILKTLTIDKKGTSSVQEPLKFEKNSALAENNVPFPEKEEEELTTSPKLPEKNEIAAELPVAINTEPVIAPGTSETNANPALQPEMMTPEMLHHLLVGDEMANLITENEPDNDFTLWSVGARVSPVYSFRTIQGDGFSTPEDNVDEEYFDVNEEGIMTIAGGISLSYNFNDNLSLGSGLYVSRIGQANTAVVAYDDPDGYGGSYKLASSAGTVTINPRKFEMVMVEQPGNVKDSIPGDYVVNGKFVVNMDYLEVPFVLNYKVLDKKVTINLNGGLSPGILVNNRSYFDIDGQKIQTGTTEDLKPTIFNSLLGMGFGYSITKNLIFSIEPTFKYSLSPINSNTGMKYRPYSMSWFTGISYKL
jgi:hypothetical protein